MNSSKTGEAIRTLRMQAGYTQSHLAECLHVTDKAVSKWERGLSVPDISIITKVANILNCDVENLLEGNVTYLENTWQGLLILKGTKDVHADTEIYGKPLVYILLSYFVLAGIRDIYISGNQKDRSYIQSKLKNGSEYGIVLRYINSVKEIPAGNTMAVYNNPFFYGLNLTKFFQRAKSRSNGVTALTINKPVSEEETKISYDSKTRVVNQSGKGITQTCTPVVFFTKEWLSYPSRSIPDDFDLVQPTHAEPIGNGMIEYCITDKKAALDTSAFIRYIEDKMGQDIYNLHNIAKHRGLTGIKSKPKVDR